MTTTPDIALLGADQLIELKKSIDDRLAKLGEDHIAAGQALGLKLVDDNGKAPRKKRVPKDHEQV